MFDRDQTPRETFLERVKEVDNDGLRERELFKTRRGLQLTWIGYELATEKLKSYTFYTCKFDNRLSISDVRKLLKINKSIYFVESNYKILYTTCKEFAAMYNILGEQGADKDTLISFF